MTTGDDNGIFGGETTTTPAVTTTPAPATTTPAPATTAAATTPVATTTPEAATTTTPVKVLSGILSKKILPHDNFYRKIILTNVFDKRFVVWLSVEFF